MIKNENKSVLKLAFRIVLKILDLIRIFFG